MIDECMGKKASRLVIELLKLVKPNPIEAHFLLDHLGSQGVHDVDWTRSLAEDGDWCVITCDYLDPKGMKARAKGPPLHLILPSRRITGFFFAGKIGSQSGFVKARSIIYVFPELLQHAESDPPGSRFKIRMTGNHFKLESWPPKALLPLPL